VSRFSVKKTGSREDGYDSTLCTRKVRVLWTSHQRGGTKNKKALRGKGTNQGKRKTIGWKMWTVHVWAKKKNTHQEKLGIPGRTNDGLSHRGVEVLGVKPDATYRAKKQGNSERGKKRVGFSHEELEALPSTKPQVHKISKAVEGALGTRGRGTG